MYAMAMLITEAGGGRIGEIARTFGVDWTHLVAQMISFCIVCILLQRFAYKPVLKMLEERRWQIAQGQANAEQIKIELSRTETRSKEMLDQANAQGNKLIEEARAAAARVQEQETQKAIAAAEQVMRCRRQKRPRHRNVHACSRNSSRSSAGCSSRPPPRSRERF